MRSQTERLLGTSWNRLRDAGYALRDAGSAVGDAAVRSRLGNSLSHAKDTLALGAGVEAARRGTRATVNVFRKHPVLSIIGAVALVSLGMAAVSKRRQRQELREYSSRFDTASTGTGARRIKVRDMRGDGGQRYSTESSGGQSQVDTT